MQSLIDEVMPTYDFHERHSRWIDAPPERVWQALATLSFTDLTLTRPLVALRGLRPGRSHHTEPLFQRGPVTIYETDPPRYGIGGLVARPWQPRPAHLPITTLAEFARFDEPGWTKCLTDFQLVPERCGVRLSTETRGYSTDDRARRRFAAYWALIRLPSGLIRRDMLAAVDRRAKTA